MKDIETAKNLLVEENLTIVLVKKGEVFFKSKERGIKPLYKAYTTMKNEMRGCSAADKVVGTAAAWLYANADIKELHCNVIAEKGSVLLKNKRINVSSNLKVEYIKNRQKDDMCPVEKLAKDETEFEMLLKKINKFILENN